MIPAIESALADHWFVVASSQSLSAGTTTRTQLLGAQIILFRDEAGQPGASVQHGPRETDIHPIFACERYTLIWVSFKSPCKPLFAIPEFDQPGRRIVPCGALGVKTSGLRVVENFLDLAHLPYVHTGWLGQESHSEVKRYEVNRNQDTDELWAADCRFWQPRAALSANGGFEVEYTYRVMQPFSTMLYKSSPARPTAFDFILLCVQPTADEQCLVYSVLGYFDDVSSDAELISFMQLIFGQDKPILENQRPKRIPLDTHIEVPTRADALSTAYRRWLREKRITYGVHRHESEVSIHDQTL